MNAATIGEIAGLIPALLADENGQGMVEYALIIALLSIATIGVMTTLGNRIRTTLSRAAGSLS
jgi:Flp pilus assembly pilin Flp